MAGRLGLDASAATCVIARFSQRNQVTHAMRRAGKIKRVPNFGGGRIRVHVGAGFKPAPARAVVRGSIESARSRLRLHRKKNPARWADDPENISRAVSAEAGRV